MPQLFEKKFFISYSHGKTAIKIKKQLSDLFDHWGLEYFADDKIKFGENFLNLK